MNDYLVMYADYFFEFKELSVFGEEWCGAVYGSHQTVVENLWELHFKAKKLIEAHLLSEDNEKDGFEKGCALIRSNLMIDPCSGSEEDWASWYAQALWLEQFRLRNQAEMIANLFGEKNRWLFPPTYHGIKFLAKKWANHKTNESDKH